MGWDPEDRHPPFTEEPVLFVSVLYWIGRWFINLYHIFANKINNIRHIWTYWIIEKIQVSFPVVFFAEIETGSVPFFLEPDLGFGGIATKILSQLNGFFVSIPIISCFWIFFV